MVRTHYGTELGWTLLHKVCERLTLKGDARQQLQWKRRRERERKLVPGDVTLVTSEGNEAFDGIGFE